MRAIDLQSLTNVRLAKSMPSTGHPILQRTPAFP